MGGWIGVDLDGVLAKYTGWHGSSSIGEPVPKMVERVKGWLSQGKTVKILTARAAHGGSTKAIEDWCKKHIGRVLPVTSEKDSSMTELWDDRAIQVKKNTGERADCGKSMTSDFSDLENFVKSKDDLMKASYAQPYYGPRGGKYADPQHKIPWDDKKHDVFGGFGDKNFRKLDDWQKRQIEHKRDKSIAWRIGWSENNTKLFAESALLSWASYGKVDVPDIIESLKRETGLDWKQTKTGKRGEGFRFEAKLPPEKKPDSDKKKDTVMKKSEFTELEEFVKSSILPTGAPSMGGNGEEQGESNLAGKGKQGGNGTSAPGAGTSGAPSPKKEKLSEDDAEEEKQMSEHKKPIEVTRKSLSPANQREMVAKEHAALVSRLQKSEDVEVRIERPETAPVANEMQKSHTWSQGPDSLVQYSNKSDIEAMNLLKSGDGFYHFSSPSVGRGVPGIAQFIECPMCKERMSKSLTACPECGYGEVTHRVMPMSISKENEMAKSEIRGPLLRPAKHIDVDVSNGVVVDKEEN